MSINAVLQLLLKALEDNNKLILSWSAISQWQDNVLNTLLEYELVTPIENASHVQCQICENHCAVDVYAHQYPQGIKYYAVCLDPVLHSEIGRMSVPVEQLQQWKVSVKQLAVTLAKLLEVDSTSELQTCKDKIRLGMLKTDSGRKWVSLTYDPLALELNQCLLPLTEILYFEQNKLCLDKQRITTTLNLIQPPMTKPYTANQDKRSEKKAKTQAMYQDWQSEFDRLKSANPTKSKSWLCNKIARLPIAQGKSAETIRKVVQS